MTKTTSDGNVGWLQHFTRNNEREITEWTPENAQGRVEQVYVSFGGQAAKGLALGFGLYRHASEIAHGTLFGTLFSWGAMQMKPLDSPDSISEFRTKKLRLLLRIV